MRKIASLFMLIGMTASMSAQTDSLIFKGYLENKEYNVYIKMNFYDEDIEVPGQELFGQLPGYLGKINNSFAWLITSAKIKNSHTAVLSMINDYGSEDLTATLTQNNDSTFTLRQGEGSAIKVPNKGKWQKLPATLEFKKTKKP